jgi:hypothetical protein
MYPNIDRQRMPFGNTAIASFMSCRRRLFRLCEAGREHALTRPERRIRDYIANEKADHAWHLLDIEAI